MRAMPEENLTADTFFRSDKRLGIPLPVQEKDWMAYSEKEQEEILFRWEQIRGQIPDRIKEIERELIQLQDRMFTEEDFDAFCEVAAEAAERASRVNSLNIWFRTEPTIALRSKHTVERVRVGSSSDKRHF